MVLALDVDDDTSVAQLFGRMGDSIDVLVKETGIYSINAVEDESLEQFRQMMETNYGARWTNGRTDVGRAKVLQRTCEKDARC